MAHRVYSIVAILLVALAAFSTCDDAAKKPELTGFALANNHFGFNLLNLLAEENEAKPEQDNVFFSPYSISIALAMLYQGSNGNTANELESTLGYQVARLDTDKAALANQIRESDTAILEPKSSGNVSYVLKAGNALLQNKDFEVLDAFKQSLTTNFRAELFSVDFKTEAGKVQTLVNNWVDNKTNGKIKKLLTEPPSADTLLALVNAVYFKGTWKTKFDPEATKPDTFNGPKGVKHTDVPFMNIKKKFRITPVTEWNATLLELPYVGDELSFFAILPAQESAELKTLRKKLTTSSVETAIGQLRAPEKIHITFPKLDFKTRYELVETLKTAGIKDVFDSSKADLSAISAAQRLRVDVVKHMATIEVNEEGAEAAGATYVGITKTALVGPLTHLVFNRPFVFFIRHNQNGQVLFLGEVNKFK